MMSKDEPKVGDAMTLRGVLLIARKPEVHMSGTALCNGCWFFEDNPYGLCCADYVSSCNKIIWKQKEITKDGN